MSAVLQYSVLVYFFWTAAEAVLLYLKLVEVFHNEGRHFLLKASLVAWGESERDYMTLYSTTVEPHSCGHLGDLVKCPVYSGTPIL